MYNCVDGSSKGNTWRYTGRLFEISTNQIIHSPLVNPSETVIMCDENYLLTNCSLLGHGSRIGTKTIPPYRINNHPKKVWRTMNDMRIRKLLCDVTLVADSVEIPAHKMVLASCSRYFYAMFNSCFVESKQERITLKEVDHQALVLLIEYAYISEVTITEENVEALLSVANLLQFMDVRDACRSLLGTKTIPPYRNNYHPEKVLRTINDLRIQKLLCDVTLVADSVEIPAHKMVLASCSPYFYTMFNSCFEESKQDRITLKEVDHQSLVLLIEYAYTSEVTITEENVEALLPAANLLQFMDVRDACCEFLKAQLDPTNCLGIRAFADIHGCLDLLVNSEVYIEQHFPEVVECDDFSNLTFRQVSKWISKDFIVTSEEKVFECVIAWVRHDLENRRHHLASLMEHVRLPLLSQHYLKHTVEMEPLFRVDPQCYHYFVEAMKYHLLSGDEKRKARTPRTKPRRSPKVLLVVEKDGWNDCSVECFDFTEERWYQVAEMPTERWGLGLAVLNGKAYAVGGDFNGHTVQTVDVYDPFLDQWTSCANMKTKRHFSGVTVLDDLIYAVGGVDGSVDSFCETLSTAEVFDTKKQSWKMISPMSTRRSRVGVGVLDGLLYAVGGYNGAFIGSSALSSVECYNPKTDTWLRVPDMLFRRDGPGVGVIDGILYAVGGRDGFLHRKSVEAYDPDKKTWTPVADMAVGRSGAGVVAMNGLLYVVGGYDGSGGLSSVEVYNPEEDTWTMLPSCMGAGRSSAGVAIIEKSIMKVTCC